MKEIVQLPDRLPIGSNPPDLKQFLSQYNGVCIFLIAVKVEEINRYDNYLTDIDMCLLGILSQLQTDLNKGSHYRVNWNSLMSIVIEGDILKLAGSLAMLLHQNRRELLINRCAIIELTGSPEQIFAQWEGMLGESLMDFVKQDDSEKIQVIEGKIMGK